MRWIMGYILITDLTDDALPIQRRRLTVHIETQQPLAVNGQGGIYSSDRRVALPFLPKLELTHNYMISAALMRILESWSVHTYPSRPIASDQ